MKLKLPAGAFRAYLFDCDGTIADSMPLHYIAWKTVLAEWNCEYDEELFYSWGGKPVRNIIADLNEIHGLKMPIDAVATKKEALYLEQLPQLKAIPEEMCIRDRGRSSVYTAEPLSAGCEGIAFQRGISLLRKGAADGPGS